MRRRPQTLRQQIEPTRCKSRLLFNDTVTSMRQIEAEADRVSNLMRNAGTVLDELDREFEASCKLTRTDVKFLFLAVALQCARQYIFGNDAFRLTDREGDALVKNFVPKDWRSILLDSVPYDAIRVTDAFAESTGLSGITHRYRTLGHDPFFGWIFGPINIISDSLTKTDFITTYSVQNMRIYGYYPAGTLGAFKTCFAALQSEKMLLPIAVLRQALHFGSDYFTKQGLPIPVISSLNDSLAKSLLAQYHIDMYSVTRGAILSMIINAIISYIHTLFYNSSIDGSREMYEVRTRRLVTYSNVIASSSNIIYTIVQNMCGNMYSLKNFDAGGILVTLYRICTDSRYIFQLKMEFLSKKFFDLTMNTN